MEKKEDVEALPDFSAQSEGESGEGVFLEPGHPESHRQEALDPSRSFGLSHGSLLAKVVPLSLLFAGAIFASVVLLPPPRSSPYLACALSLSLAFLVYWVCRRSHERARSAREAKLSQAATLFAAGSSLIQDEGDPLLEAFKSSAHALETRWREDLKRREKELRRESQRELVKVRSQCEALIEKYVDRMHQEKKQVLLALEALKTERETEKSAIEEDLQSQAARRKTAEWNVERLEKEVGELETMLGSRLEECSRLSVEVERLLEEVDKLQKQSLRFFDKVAGQLRGPLQIIDKLASELYEKDESLARKKEEGEEKPRSVEARAREIRARLAQLSRLVDQILDLCRLESSSFSIVYSEVEPGELVKSCEAEVVEAAESKRIEVASKKPKNGLRVLTDARLLKKILRELFSNAVRYTPRGGRVSLELTVSSHEPPEWKGPLPRSQDWLRVDVADTGDGIKEEDYERIFDAFERGVDPQFTSSDVSPGLGLTLAKEYAKLLGGEIFLQSKVGRGSTFSLALPVKVCMTTHVR